MSFAQGSAPRRLVLAFAALALIVAFLIALWRPWADSGSDSRRPTPTPQAKQTITTPRFLELRAPELQEQILGTEEFNFVFDYLFFTSAPGTVIRQIPSAGKPISLGGKLKLTLSLGPKEDSSPHSDDVPWQQQVTNVPIAYKQSWERSPIRDSCPLLVIEDLGIGKDAAIRIADVGDGWGVRYDLAGSDGTDRTGRPCRGCGRSSFGISTSANTQTPSSNKASGHESAISGRGFHSNEFSRHWPDGSKATYGLDGFLGPSFVANLRIPTRQCSYRLWTHLGRGHLEFMLEHLRRS